MKIQYYQRILISLLLLFSFLVTGLAAQESDENAGDVLMNKLSGFKSKQKEALNYIARKKPVQLIPRIARALLEEDDAEQRDVYIRAMKSFHRDNTILYWFDILKETRSFSLKVEIIKYLGTLGDRRIVLPVARNLESRFSVVRKEAAIVLRRNGDDRIYPFILRMAGDRNPVKRIYALEAMQILYDIRFYSLITTLVEDPVKSVRIYAIKCVEENKLKKAMFLVKKAAIKDRDREVRIAAINVIGKMRDTGGAFALTRSLADSDRDVRCAAARSINLLGLGSMAFTVSNRLLLEKDSEIRYILLESLLKMRRTGNLEALKKVFSEDTNFRHRILAARILGKVTSERHLSLLLESKNDKDYRVRAEIAESLSSYRSARSQKGLFAFIRNDKKRYVRSAALFSLYSINDRSSIIPLFDQFSDEEDVIFREQLRQILRRMIKRRV